MGFFKELKELIRLEDDIRENETKILLITSEYINEDHFPMLADFVHDGKVLILDMSDVDPYIGARAMEFVCGAIRAKGGYGYAMGSEFFIYVPNKDNYKVLCKGAYNPKEREVKGNLLWLK